MRLAPVFALCALPVLVGGCLPGFDLFGPTDDRECRFDNDCDDDEECRRGECVALDDGSEGEGEGEGDPPPDPQGPRFLQLSTNITSMGPYDTLVITAVLTDDDGVDDIIGGSLVDPDSGSSYGAFQTSASEGSYQLTVTWSAMNAVDAIDFTSSGTRRLQARFFDVAGHEAAQSVSVTLTCNGGPACAGACGAARCGDGSCTSADGYPDSNQYGICGGTCRDLATNTDCGGCGTTCGGTCALIDSESPVCTCQAGDCSSGSACVDQQCQESSGVTFTALSGSTPNDGLAELIVYGYGNSLCGFSETEADLFCRAAGYSEGSLSSLPSYTGYSGYSVNCTGAALFLDCTFTYDSSCDDNRVVHCGPPDPPGDFTCTDVDLGSATGTSTGSTSGLTNGFSSCAGNGPERIYRWRAPTTGTYTFDTSGSALDTVLTVLDADCAGASLGCDNDGYGSGDSYLYLSVVNGRDYVIVVDSMTSTGSSFSLRITPY